MNMQEWLDYAMNKGWCGPIVCGVHDGLPMSEAESEESEPCIAIIRLYMGYDEKEAVEEFHLPSQWRKEIQ